MIPELYVTSQRTLRVEMRPDEGSASLPPATSARIERAFNDGEGTGLLHLSTIEIKAALGPTLTFARGFAQRYITQLCHIGDPDIAQDTPLVAQPSEEELSAMVLEAPPMRGLEYLDAETLRTAWLELDKQVRHEASAQGQGLRAYLHAKNPLWRLVGRVTFHLAENKQDEEHPFAFLATYASGLSDRGAAKHLPLARALQEYAGGSNRKRLVALLTPVREASEHLTWVQDLVEIGDIYQALAWTPAEAHRFLRDIPILETSGLIVRIPNWWKADRPPRPQVSVKVGGQQVTSLGADSLLDFSVAVTLGGEPLTESEKRELLSSTGGLMRLRGQWVEADGEKLAAALAHWESVETRARSGGISFFEGMRLLAGDNRSSDAIAEASEPLREWSGVEPGDWLRDLLARIRNPGCESAIATPDLRATLRPYQMAGVKWLALLTSLGLGACLADDMGLGKTIQVLTLLLHLRSQDARGATDPAGSRPRTHHDVGIRVPSLIVAPASLIGNWKSEIERFAPALSFFIAHPSGTSIDLSDERALDAALAGTDVVITTYGVVTRSQALRDRRWRLLVLDEAQAIKNSGSQQARTVKQLGAAARIALTGTPVENRLSDLWSLFDFLNPGLLGDARGFARAAKSLAERTDQPYAPLRRLVQPYILRRLKTDKQVITDLPEKTEVRAFCGLTREQAAIYEQRVQELAMKLAQTEGIQRRGMVLAYLMQLKQICNHPAQWEGQGGYTASRSGKFERLAAICEELAERQERVLVFTQFREITEPLSQRLGEVFGRPGLVLHGGTAVSKRRALVDDFQREDGPPFFVLSLKAGGTGLNLTAASHVIHFDRWWNPAVENQATDRAFRIGQKRNVLVHKFVCRGTVEEKIDALMEAKSGLARDLLDQGGEQLLTEMSDEDLLRTVALDIHKACDA
ncbi:MAG TPA: SNF2-related protein [Steroidobacteraceae bacterium]|nr:SNF2-related protein [Steroidobacteraceae bacterium]